MAYGDDDGAIGYLIGEANEGMRVHVHDDEQRPPRRRACRAWAWPSAPTSRPSPTPASACRAAPATGDRSPIIDHPDVRRMLLTMKAQIAAMRALCYWTAGCVDRSAARTPTRPSARRAADRVALLTPIVKAWCTDLGSEIASLGVQVHGGMGYIEETGAAQHYRDARIPPIYEGTNGIQAMDLVGRKLGMADGRLPWRLIDELRMELGEMGGAFDVPLTAAVDALERTTRQLQANADDRGSGASGYLRLFATSLGAFLLARGARAAPPAAGRWR